MWVKVAKNTEYEIHGHANSNPEMMREFLSVNNIVRYTLLSHSKDWKKFLSLGRSNPADLDVADNFRMPYTDHGRAFKTEMGDICFVSQPYMEIETVKPELKAWANERGLEVDIFDASHSWYSRGETIVIVLHLPGVSFIIP